MRDEVAILPAEREAFRARQIRIPGPHRSRCCNVDTVLVESMEGGFVTPNCSRCGSRGTLSEREFRDDVSIWVACPRCGEKMEKDFIEGVYAMTCDVCRIWVRLSKLLPRYNEI